jgi:hypothetical protein
LLKIRNMDADAENKLLFLKIILEEHGLYLKKLYQQSIDEKKIIKSGELKSSIDAKVTGTYENPKLSVSFYSYGRFIEIGYFRKDRKNYEALKSLSANQVVWGVRNSPKKKVSRKDVLWYTRNTYGSLNNLISTLMYGYSDEIIANSKSIFKKAYDYQNSFK